MQIEPEERRTPSAIRAELARYGGQNPYHKANWRIVLAEDRLVLRGGVFNTMPQGENMIEVDPKTFELHRREVKPEKVETGFHMVPKYPVKGWIMERWFPTSMLGMSRVHWESVKSADGTTPMMGPYPAEGFYFMLAGPFSRIPEMEDLKMAISMHLREEANQPASYEQALRLEINGDLEADQKAYDKHISDIAHFYESEVEPVLRGSSLTAGRIRNDLAAQLGDHSHQGVI